jgi:hypothetical protein
VIVFLHHAFPWSEATDTSIEKKQSPVRNSVMRKADATVRRMTLRLPTLPPCENGGTCALFRVSKILIAFPKNVIAAIFLLISANRCGIIGTEFVGNDAPAMPSCSMTEPREKIAFPIPKPQGG